MIRRLDKLWLHLLGRSQRWIVYRIAAHCRRELLREAEAHRRQEAVLRLERHLASQKPHLN